MFFGTRDHILVIDYPIKNILVPRNVLYTPVLTLNAEHSSDIHMYIKYVFYRFNPKMTSILKTVGSAITGKFLDKPKYEPKSNPNEVSYMYKPVRR